MGPWWGLCRLVVMLRPIPHGLQLNPSRLLSTCGAYSLSCLRPQAKLRIARAVFDQLGKADLESEGFRRFCADSWEWLQPYAVFCMLRRVFGTGEHWRWGALSQPIQEVRRPRNVVAGTLWDWTPLRVAEPPHQILSTARPSLPPAGAGPTVQPRPGVAFQHTVLLLATVSPAQAATAGQPVCGAQACGPQG